ncbi:MAG TPA: acetamidase/formamidase family protein [Vicinamibacteria bacterium]|nr:acetamidase/formamidase family protein [Vicinamibacteria bacterium]
MLKRIPSSLVPWLVLPVLLLPLPSFAQARLSGTWLLTTDVFGNPWHQRLTLEQKGDTLAGRAGSDKVEGTLQGGAVRFVSKPEGGGRNEYAGAVSGESISGTVVLVDGETGERVSSTFTARRVPERRAGPPGRHEFVPTTFYRRFSAETKPVLTVAPGDTVHTTTVDAGGTDEKGVSRVLGGNPQTGPFYVETALPGDVLAVHIVRLKLNRDWAVSDDSIVPRALDGELAVKLKDAGKMARWHLDRDRGTAALEKPTEHLGGYSVPLRPMLGCVGVAPGFGSAGPGTGDSGGFGGNMDFSGIVEGTTVFLPVLQPGALLYLGDGHAAQGDGELNGNALETSMEVEFTVDVVPEKTIATPRVESATHLVVVGLDGSLEGALKEATSGMAQWLEQDYGLTPSEVAQVLGTASEIVVNEVADRNAGIALRLAKDRLQPLARTSAAKK